MKPLRSHKPNALAWSGMIVALFIVSVQGSSALHAQTPTARADLPTWIDRQQWQEEDTRFVVLKTEGFLLPSHATMALVDMVRERVSQEIDALAEVGASQWVELPETYVESNLISDELILDSRQLNSSHLGRAKYYGFAKLSFTDAFAQMIQKRYQRNFRMGRLRWTGVLGAGTFGWIAILWAYLKLDDMTRHFYSRRLQSVAIALAIAVLAVAVSAVMWSAWS